MKDLKPFGNRNDRRRGMPPGIPDAVLHQAANRFRGDGQNQVVIAVSRGQTFRQRPAGLGFRQHRTQAVLGGNQQRAFRGGIQQDPRRGGDAVAGSALELDRLQCGELRQDRGKELFGHVLGNDRPGEPHDEAGQVPLGIGTTPARQRNEDRDLVDDRDIDARIPQPGGKRRRLNSAVASGERAIRAGWSSTAAGKQAAI